MTQLKQYPEDWEIQKNMENASSLTDRGYKNLPAGVLQLIVGGVEKQEDFVGDSEICIPTPAFYKHTEVVNFIKARFKSVSRCGFISLEVNETVGLHIDEGTYYQTRDRYHLAIQGTYRYFVGDEYVDVQPGTFLWFNNKLKHGTVNIGDCTRITFVFDVEHNPNNPQNKLDLQDKIKYNNHLEVKSN